MGTLWRSEVSSGLIPLFESGAQLASLKDYPNIRKDDITLRQHQYEINETINDPLPP